MAETREQEEAAARREAADKLAAAVAAREQEAAAVAAMDAAAGDGDVDSVASGGVATDDETGIEGNSFSSDRNPFRGHALRLEAGVFEAGVAGMHEKAFFVSARRVEDWSPIFAGWNGQSYRRHRWVLSAE